MRGRFGDRSPPSTHEAVHTTELAEAVHTTELAEAVHTTELAEAAHTTEQARDSARRILSAMIVLPVAVSRSSDE